MALPSSGSLSFSQINVELGKSASAAISLGDAAVRALAGRTSGTISFSDLRGKSAVAAPKTFTITIGRQTSGYVSGSKSGSTHWPEARGYGTAVDGYLTWRTIGAVSPAGLIGFLELHGKNGTDYSTAAPAPTLNEIQVNLASGEPISRVRVLSGTTVILDTTSVVLDGNGWFSIPRSSAWLLPTSGTIKVEIYS